MCRSCCATIDEKQVPVWIYRSALKKTWLVPFHHCHGHCVYDWRYGQACASPDLWFWGIGDNLESQYILRYYITPHTSHYVHVHVHADTTHSLCHSYSFQQYASHYTFSHSVPQSSQHLLPPNTYITPCIQLSHLCTLQYRAAASRLPRIHTAGSGYGPLCACGSAREAHRSACWHLDCTRQRRCTAVEFAHCREGVSVRCRAKAISCSCSTCGLRPTVSAAGPRG